MEYTWNMEEANHDSVRTARAARGQGPGLIDELEAFMAPVGEGYPPVDARRLGGHQLPESPPDSGSENPYSPETQAHPITVSQNVLTSDYMLVPDHIPTHEILHQNGDYIYEELKSDNIDHDLRNNLNDVVILPQDPNIVELGIRTVRHDLNLDPIGYQNRYNQIRVDMADLDQGIINPQLVALGHDNMTPVYTNLQEPTTKKRKHSQDVSQVKCEPAALSPSQPPLLRGAPPSVDGSEAGDDTPLQCIRFAPFHHTPWFTLYDCNLKPLPTPSYIVGADKGFNYSQIDEAFVCQKKNHFQVTCQIQVQAEPHYVKMGDGFKKITGFALHFYGVKAEDPSQEVRIEQSQSDRTKKPFHPVPVELRREGTKITVGRLHFAETTNNNMRKKGRPNPDQRHFQLVVALRARASHNECLVSASASDRIIVRASNPGQFESDCSENWWQRGVSENSVHFNGRVGINTDRPDEACVVNGNLKVMGHIVHPSDARAKHNIEELDTAQQLKNVQSIRVVKFNYDPSFAEHSGLLGFDPTSPSPRLDTGVIAQEVRRVLPEAVREAGDVTLPSGHTIHKFLVVNKDRIFMENLGAVKELCKVTGNLESRIDQLERMNKRLAKIGLSRRDSSRSSVSNDSRYSASSNSSKSLYSDGNISLDHIRDIARNIRKHECCQKLSHNSPKYTRKQCKNCHGNYTKYGKYYNYNKTVKSTKEKEKTLCPSYTNTLESKSEEFSKKETSIWVREESDYDSRLAFCCRKRDRYTDSSTEWISNKTLQIVITILIFIMAVCLAVMCALYYREHQELISIRESRFDKMSNYYNSHQGKPFVNTAYRTPPDHNQIQNLKPSQHPTQKKTVKEKGSHKTTLEYTTTTPIEQPPTLMTTLHTAKNYVQKILNIEQTTAAPRFEKPVSVSRIADMIGGCSFNVNSDNELDAECQSSCGLDPPQTYENQEPLERSPKKDLNDTFVRPLEFPPKDKLPHIPVIANETKSKEYKSEPIFKSDDFKINESHKKDDIIHNESYKKDNDVKNNQSFKKDDSQHESHKIDDFISNQSYKVHDEVKNNESFKKDDVKINEAYKDDELKNNESYKENEFKNNESFKENDFGNKETYKTEDFKINESFKDDEIKNKESYKTEEFKNKNFRNEDDYKINESYKVDEIKSKDFKGDLNNESFKKDDFKAKEFKTDNFKVESIKNDETYKLESFKKDEDYKGGAFKKDDAYKTDSFKKEEVFNPEAFKKDENYKPESFKNDESYKIQDEILAESNHLDPSKNVTVRARLKRNVEGVNSAFFRSSSEEMILSRQSESDEVLLGKDCDTIHVGVSSKTVTNTSVFVERDVCYRGPLSGSISTGPIHVYNYTMPLSRCADNKHLDLLIRSSKLQDLRLCHADCKDQTENCAETRETVLSKPATDLWSYTMTFAECSVHRILRIRGGFTNNYALCHLTMDSKDAFIEFNIHVYRNCLS